MKIIPLSDLSLLMKCMGMSMSKHDGEALVAIRRANAILLKHKFTWEELLRKQVGTGTNAEIGYSDDAIYEGEPGDTVDRFKRAAPTMDVEEAFSYLRNRNMGEFRGFLDSIEKFYRDNEYLTKGQRAPLFSAVKSEKAKDGR